MRFGDMLDINTTTCQEFACAEHWMAISIPTHSFETGMAKRRATGAGLKPKSM